MAGSQLKRLKASLRDQGIVGPQQSKKQKRKNAQDEPAKRDKRLQRRVVLEGIRQQFNPFDLAHATRGPKFEVTTNRPATSSIKGRPSAMRAAGEERRRQTLLVDMQRRNKVGGILDKRFGEGDASMNEEDKAIERFAREKQRNHKKMSLFDLEENDDSIEALTHGGKTLAFDEEEMRDDFDEDDLGSDSDLSERGQQRLKRLRAMGYGDGDDPGEPERKKTKKEVMEEVIAKSKSYKMERQAVREEDDDLRAELDKELPDIQRLLSTGKKRAMEETGTSNSVIGMDREKLEKEYDIQLKKLAQDGRAQPADRTKTDEEKAEENSKRLKVLEDKRRRRMGGEDVSDSDESSEDKQNDVSEERDAEMDVGEDDDFGLGSGIKIRPTATELGFDDEDDFLIDDDLVASGSEIESLEDDLLSDVEEETEEKEAANDDNEDDDDDEFITGLLNEEEARNPIFDKKTSSNSGTSKKSDDRGLPFTFPIPLSLEDFKSVIQAYKPEDIPTIVQRIRALYHPKLDSKNKELLATFSIVLVDFIASTWSPKVSPSPTVFESLIRHIHSLAKSYPNEIGKQFRSHFETIGKSRSLAISPADLILLTAAGSIFPTSDHFHQVVTPATLTITRYLGQKVAQDLPSFATGTYLTILALGYQQLSKRYLPEAINFSLNTLCAIAPKTVLSSIPGNFPLHEAAPSIRLQNAQGTHVRKLTLSDCLFQKLSKEAQASLQVSIVDTTLLILDAAADIWAGKDAFTETFDQVILVLQACHNGENRAHLPKTICNRSDRLLSKLERMKRLAQVSRRPLELHHHKPLAIKTFIPKFEETFDPDKHYDPNRDRAELAKLKAEHRREHKGAMRELRKDANFMARENLRAKKAKDEAYEKKYSRLVAEIQSEEGRDANAYEREKSARKRARNR